MKSLKIKHIHRGRKGNLYSLQYHGEKLSVYERFINSDDFRQCSDFELVIAQIHLMLEKEGFRIGRYLKPISKPDDSVYEIKGFPRNGLRLFCLRFGSDTLIVGFSGKKTTQTIQENPSHAYQQRLLRELDHEISERMKANEITYDDNGILKGNLTFDMDTI